MLHSADTTPLRLSLLSRTLHTVCNAWQRLRSHVWTAGRVPGRGRCERRRAQTQDAARWVSLAVEVSMRASDVRCGWAGCPVIWFVFTCPGQSELACELEVEGCVLQRLPRKDRPRYSLPAGIERVGYKFSHFSSLSLNESYLRSAFAPLSFISNMRFDKNNSFLSCALLHSADNFTLLKRRCLSLRPCFKRRDVVRWGILWNMYWCRRTVLHTLQNQL